MLREAAARIATVQGEPTSDVEAYRREGRESAAETLCEMADEAERGAERGARSRVLVVTETETTTVEPLDEEGARALLAYWRERGYIDEPEMITLHPSMRARTVSRGPEGELVIVTHAADAPVPITPIGIVAGDLVSWTTTFPVVIPPSEHAWDVLAAGDGVQVTRAKVVR